MMDTCTMTLTQKLSFAQTFVLPGRNACLNVYLRLIAARLLPNVYERLLNYFRFNTIIRPPIKKEVFFCFFVYYTLILFNSVDRINIILKRIARHLAEGHAATDPTVLCDCTTSRWIHHNRLSLLYTLYNLMKYTQQRKA